MLHSFITPINASVALWTSVEIFVDLGEMTHVAKQLVE